MAQVVETLRWRRDRVELLDQRAIPQRLAYVACATAAEVAAAIREMIVRGAPAIGCAAAFGIALEAGRPTFGSLEDFYRAIEQAFEELGASRPTAINLFWAIDRMRRAFEAYQYVAPAVLTPLAAWLWWRHYDGDVALATIALAVPITYAYFDGCVYAFSALGRKIRIMREQPCVCFEIEQIDGPSCWRSVIADGTYEELTDGAARREALSRLGLTDEHIVPRTLAAIGSTVVFRLRLSEKSGRFERRDD